MDIIMALSALVCWLIIGYRTDRKILGFFLGIIWMFVPYNFFNLVVNDDINEMVCIAVSPLLVYAGFDYIKTKSKIMPVISACLLLFIRQTDVYAAAVFSAAIVIMLLLWKMINSDKHGIVAPIIAVCLPNIISVVKSFTVKGYYHKNFGVSKEVLKHSVSDMLNPVFNFKNAEIMAYFGVSVLIIAIFGFICSHRKTNIVFLYGIILMIFAIEPVAGWFEKVSGFRKDRINVLIVISYAVIFTGFMMWDTLKKKILIAVCVLLCLDIVPSTIIVYAKRNNPAVIHEEEISDGFLKEAQRVTNNKMIITGRTDGDKLSDALAESMDLGEYLYVFDRSIASKYDTVVIQKSKLRNGSNDMDKVREAAEKEGYTELASDDRYVLYHNDKCESSSFTVKDSYKAIGIGSRIHQLAMIYPNIYESSETDIDKYSVSELSKYDTVYLSGFTYSDRKTAEKIIKETAKSSTKVVIDADGMPYDEMTRVRKFLGVSCNDISFENGYPNLEIDGKEVVTELFGEDYSQWQGVYLNGLDKSDGEFVDNGKKISFMGSAGNKKIKFIGINLIGYYAITYDDNIKPYLDKMLGFKQEDAPKHEIVIKND